MSNISKVEVQKSIQSLHEKGWSERRIARELGVHRATVKRYCCDSKCTNPQTGSSDSKCTNPQTGKKGPSSACEPHRERILEWYESGLSVERIHADLLSLGFESSYYSVYRFVKTLEIDESKRIYRMECEPGQEAQIDYGTVYLPIGENGRKKKVHILIVTLSHSRKSYVEAVLSQNTESFLRSIENALRHFGGVPERLCPDNLKAAVIKADWYEPQLNPKLRDFATHYDTVILPSRPYTPTDKGKVEAAVKYVKNNALKGKAFASLTEVNEHLRWWTANVAAQVVGHNLLMNLADHREVEFAGEHDAVTELSVEFKGLVVGNGELGGEVDLQAELAGLEDAGHVRRDDGVDAMGFGRFQELVAELQVVVIEQRVEREVAANACCVAALHNRFKVIDVERAA